MSVNQCVRVVHSPTPVVSRSLSLYHLTEVSPFDARPWMCYNKNMGIGIHDIHKAYFEETVDRDKAKALAIDAIGRGLSIFNTALLVGLNPSTIYEWMRNDAEFHRSLYQSAAMRKFEAAGLTIKNAKAGEFRAIERWDDMPMPEDEPTNDDASFGDKLRELLT